MEDKNLLISFVFFVFVIFIINNSNISGSVVENKIDVSHRFCIDDDNGLKPYTPGYVRSDIGSFNDKCIDNLHQVREYFCTDGPHGGKYKVLSRVINCGDGYKCVRDVKNNADACVKL